MRNVLVFLFYLFSWSLSASAQSSVCFNRLHQGYAEILIPVNQWNDDSVKVKVYHPNTAVIASAAYRTADLAKVTASSGTEYYYLKGADGTYGNETLTFEVSSSQDAAVSNTLAALPQAQWNSAATANICGIQRVNVCFNRLHDGYADILIPVNQWNDDSVKVKVYHPNTHAIASAIYRTADLSRVTASSGTEYYYIKGVDGSYGNETLTFEVSSSQDASVCNTLDALPQIAWNNNGTADVCGVPKADVCFNRLHHGYADILIPVNQWNDDTVKVKVYHPNSHAIASAIYKTADLTRVTSSGGTEYYYLKGADGTYGNETLTYEVSSSQDAAVSNTLAALPETQWNSAATTDVCGVPKADVCFNRLHHGYADILIPVNQWNDDTVKLKIYHPNSAVIASAVYNTANLTRVTSSVGMEYYYIKGLQGAHSTETLTYEVSSSQDVAVSNTLAALPQALWSSAGTAEVCNVPKADVCFNRLHHGYAELLIPVNQWNDDTVQLKIYHPNNAVIASAIYRTADLPRVTSSSGTEYYYLKGLQHAHSTETLTYEVSSSQDVAVSNTLAVLPQEQWNSAASTDVCGVPKADVCFNRLHSAYAEMLIPINQWNGDSIRVKVYHPNNAMVASAIYATSALSRVTSPGGSEYYYLKAVNYLHGAETLTYELSSSRDAAVSNTLAVLPQAQWNDFTLQDGCINKVKGVCIDRNNASYTVYVPKATWNDTAVRVKLYHVNGGIKYNQLWTSPLSVTYNGQPYYKVSFSYNEFANEQMVSEVSSPANAAVHMLLNPVQQLCNSVDSTTPPADTNWALAPNSYLFTPDQANNGFYIPVKKAYKMWEADTRMGGAPIPSGIQSADVYWEDNHGLIKSGDNYSLQMEGSGEDAKIKVPVNKSKEGNAVIAFKVDGQIYWSWHVWVTDDPGNGANYKSFDSLKRQRNDGVVELIPSSDWGWMDRNLGATGSALTSDDWIRNGGLLYQWGRKDPIPPLITKGNDAYEASGSVGRIRHRQAKNWQNNAQKIDDLTKYVPLSAATVPNNIRLSVQNPLSLIYINKEDGSGQALYNNNANLPVNWFGVDASLPAGRLTELNLWSDNAQGVINTSNYNDDNGANPYRNKSSFDPCPNGWRMPSMLVANIGNTSYVDDIRVDFSPFGPKSNIHTDSFMAGNYHIIKPNDLNTPEYMKGFKVYRNVGMDLSNVGGNDMGIFPGTGILARDYHEGQYTDQHESYLWTATMVKWFDGTAAISARSLRLIPDGDQPDIPDASLPAIKGRYQYYPSGSGATSGANGCRCIKDPLFRVNEYDFPTEFFNDEVEYMVGLNDPNTYTVVKDSTQETTIEIPVSKAFSAQSQLLNNPDILNASSYNNLKVNVLWSTNTSLISNISISNATPATLDDLSNTKIDIKIAPNQSGNAVVTLHNGSITNPIYWSWHVWVTNSEISSVSYTPDQAMTEAPNYVNYVNGSQILKTEFMDRNLGAVEAFPTVVGDNLNPETQLPGASQKIILSGGLHYQWGRKDPIPTYRPARNTDYTDANGVANNYKSNAVKYYLGTVNTNGTVSYSALTEAAYNASYIKAYNTYSNASNANVLATDKPSEKVAKVLSYSINNPLAFMVPSTFAAVDNSNSNYNNGSDWLATEPNLAADRWGRGGKKSPFDPCPEGWRIPDFTGSEPAAGYGVSPWYKKGLEIGLAKRALDDYLGVRVRIGKTVNAGFTYNNANYKIGNYPIFTGIRGNRSVTANTTPDYQTSDGEYTGIWSASLASNYRGRPINMLFQINNSTPASNYLFAYHDNNDPYFGENCRCVKVKHDTTGKEQGPIPALSITTITYGEARNVIPESVLKEGIDKFEFYPNPVKSILYIKPNDTVKDYYYQIYNVSGRLVKSGKFENTQADLSALPAGNYMIRINNSETVVKIVKL